MGVTIVGCGDIGCRLGFHYQQQGVDVSGWVRRLESLNRLEQLGLSAVQVDLDQPLNQRLCLEGEQLFYFAPPPAKGCEDSRVVHLIEAFEKTGHPDKVVYLSTTGVYGDCQGAWVDETRKPAPLADRAKRRLSAEHHWQDWQARTSHNLVILRVAGIYGPGKLPIARLRQGLPMVSEADAPITNHIHTQDLVEAAQVAMARAPSGEIYHVCDGHPENMTHYFNQVADFLGLSRPPIITLEAARHELSPGMLSYLAESRRLSNRKLIETLGVVLKYPRLEQGLPACVAQVE
jgi:nucleoside-diphosphate-sugar epimerase